MPGIQIYLEKGEDEKVWKLSEMWKISKQDTIKKIIREFVLRRDKNEKQERESPE